MVRIKHRYIVGKFVWKDRHAARDSFTQQLFIEQIKNAIQTNFGDFHFGRIVCSGSLCIKYFNPLTGIFLVRCFREDLHELGFCLSTIRILDGELCKIESVHVGGTIRSCLKSLLSFHRNLSAQEKRKITMLD